MADKVWNNSITPETDWGGDESTGFLPVSGEKVQEFIKSQLAHLQEQVSEFKPVVVVSPSEWEQMKQAGTILPGVLYGITEETEEPQPQPGEQTVILDEEAGTLTVIDAAYNDQEETLELIGIYDPDTNTLTI